MGRFFKLVGRAFVAAGGIMTSPGATLARLSREEASSRWAAPLTGYLLPLAILPLLANLVGESLVGYRFPDGPVARYLVPESLARGLLGILLLLAGTGAAGVIIGRLSPLFGGRKGTAGGIAVAAYAATPLLAAALLNAYPPWAPFIPAGLLFGLFLAMTASGPFLEVPAERSFLFGMLCGGVGAALTMAMVFLFRILAEGILRPLF